jgi:RND superfamily putative drug exporter
VERFAEVVLRHRGAVVLLWLVLLVAGAAAAGRLSDRLSFDFSLPGQPGYQSEQQLVATYGVSSADTLVPVITVPAGQTVQDRRADVAAVFDAVRRQLPALRVVDLASTRNSTFVFDGGRRTFALVQGAAPTGFGPGTEAALAPVLKQAAAASGLQTGLTSYALLSAGGDSAGPSVLVETLLGAVGALIVLTFVFASFLALVPLVIAAVSILTTFLLALGLTELTAVSFVVQFLISLVGLGVAIDYSLLLVSRWREERAHGHDNREAVVIAMRTAGHAVLASGVTVAISMLALLVVPVPFLRSMGLGGLLIPLVSVAAVLTLLPALLSSIGPRLDWPRIRHEEVASRGWSAWSRAIVRRRWLAAGAAVVVLGLLTAPVLDLRIGQSGVDSLARSGPAFDTVTLLRQGGVGAGVLTPIEVLVPADRAEVAVAAARRVDGVRTAAVGGTRGGSALVDVLPRTETLDSDGTAVVEAVRTAVGSATGGKVGITGAGAAVGDYSSAVYGNFPYVLLIIAVITFVLLVRTFRSVLLPLKAVVLNLVSLAAVFGSVVFFWQQGHGSQSVFGVAPTGAIAFWLPVIIFAFLFGLSMDYEVFILARMREAYDATRSTSAAVVGGLSRTGRLVTSAALILFFAFAALASAPGTDIKVLGTALGAGILIDATLVRALLVPALVSLFGQWNWWLPIRLATLLRVEPSPLVHEHRDGRHTAEDTELGISSAVRRNARSPLLEVPLTLIDTAKRPILVVGTGLLSGHVRQADGRPLAAATLTLLDMAGHQAGLTHSDADGSYRLVPPTQGAYLLVAATGSHQPTASLIQFQSHPTEREIILLPTGSLTGVVREAGAPAGLPRVSVALADTRSKVIDTTHASGDGQYEITDPAEGPYTLNTSATGHRPVTLAVTTSKATPVEYDLTLLDEGQFNDTTQAASAGRHHADTTVNLAYTTDLTRDVAEGTRTDGTSGDTVFEVPDADHGADHRPPTPNRPTALLHIAQQAAQAAIAVLTPALRRMLAKRWLTVAAAAVALGVAVAWLLWPGSQSGGAPRLGTASLGTIRQTVTAIGTIEPAEQADLNFGVSGQVTAVPATVGEQVQPGQTLATVDAASLPSQLAQAHAAVASAVAKVAADRTAGASDAQVNADTAALVSANAQLAVAQQNLSKATLTAPFAGTVAAVNLTLGQQISGASSAGSSASLAGSGGGSGAGGSTGASAPGGSGASNAAAASTISASNAQVVVISTGSYIVNASVDDTEVGQLKSGEQAVIVPNGATGPIFGTVASVGMVGTQNSGVTTYPVTINVTGSPAGMAIGASAQVSITVKQLTDVLVVPRGAVHQDAGRSMVDEMTGGKQVAHPVTVGLSAGGQTQITGGLAPGTRIVLPAAPTGTGTGSGGGAGRGGGAGGFGGGGGRGPTGGTG